MKERDRQIALKILDGSTISEMAEAHGTTQARIKQALRRALVLVAPEMELPKHGTGSQFGREPLEAIRANRSELAEKLMKA